LQVPVEEVEGKLDLGGCDDVPGAGQDGNLSVGELPIGGDPVVERAVVVAVADEDQRRCGDLREVLEGVAGRFGSAVERKARSCTDCVLALRGCQVRAPYGPGSR
jgi:hypothetical protein